MQRLVQFNALPLAVRERVSECLRGRGHTKPILAQQTSILGGTVGFVMLGLFGAACVFSLFAGGYGALPDGLQIGGKWAAFWVGAYAIFVGGGLLAWRRHLLGASLPFPPGRYLLPLDFVDARGETLRLLPIAELTDFAGTHHHSNGRYTHTALTLTFGRSREAFTVRSKREAENVIQELNAGRARVMAAIEQQDARMLVALDPFFEVRAHDSWDTLMEDVYEEDCKAKALPPFLDTGVKILGIAVGVGVLLGPLSWGARNHLSDGAMYANAQVQGINGYKRYLQHGKRYVEEVRTDLLPFAELQAAKSKKSVAELRRILNDYPESIHEEETREAIHDLFVETLAKFKEHASTENADLMPVMEALIAHLEKSGSSTVWVRFAPPSADDLVRADAVISEGLTGGVHVAPVAAHFDEQSSLGREGAIAQHIAQGFKRVFPTDILELTPGTRLSDVDEEAPLDTPSLDIHYTVSGSGDYYSDPTRPERAFVGIVVTFQATLRIPNNPRTLDFTLRVVPPDQFQVRYQSRYASFLPPPNHGADGSNDTLVYQVMAMRAFDELAGKLHAEFFKEVDPDDPFNVR